VVPANSIFFSFSERRLNLKDFTTGSIPKQLIVFALPLLLGNFLQMAVDMMNMVWVGRIIGHEAIASVATSMPIVFFLISILIGMSIAANIIVAQAFSTKNYKYMEKTFANSFMVSVALCVILSVLGIVFSKQLLTIIKCPPEIMPQANSFFRVVLIGLSFNFIYNWYSGIQRGLGDSKTPLYILIFNAVLNLISVPLLVMKFGLIGAPIGNIISGVISLIAGYFYASYKNPFFNIREWDFTVEWSIIKKLFTIGVPASLQMVITSIAGSVIMSFVNGFGTIVTASAGIGQQCDQLAFLPSMAVGFAVTSMAAQNISAKKYDRVQEILKYGIILSCSIAAFFTVVIFFFPEQIVSFFNKDPLTAALIVPHAVDYLRIVCFTYIGFALVFSFMGVVRSSGDTMAILILTFISAVIFRIPLTWFLSQKTPLAERGIWTAILISTYVTLILNYFYYKSGRWKNRKLLSIPGRIERVKAVEEQEIEIPK